MPRSIYLHALSSPPYHLLEPQSGRCKLLSSPDSSLEDLTAFMPHPTLHQDPVAPSATPGLQWPPYETYNTAGSMSHFVQQSSVRPIRSEATSVGACAGYMPPSSSSSSLAMALDETVLEIQSSSPHTTISGPQLAEEPFGCPPLVYLASGSVDGFQSAVPSSIEGYSTEVHEAMPTGYGFGMYFPESTYQEQYPATFGKEMPAFAPYPQGEVAASHFSVMGYERGLAINTNVVGDEYVPSGPFSPLSGGYAYAFDSPLEDDPVVMSTPTAAQISRSSTLANAIKLPEVLQPQQPSPPASSPQPLVGTSTQSPANITPTMEPSQSISQASTAGPSSSSSSSTKKRPTKTGRPRGRPPKHPLTFLPRHKFGQLTDSDGKPSVQSAGSYSAPENHTQPLVELPMEDGMPGQSSFMLDNAIPEPPKKKPIMACLFCRERKIACGPPPPEQEDQTCKQCLRRDLICEWPTESKRGQHKRFPRKKEAENGAQGGRDSAEPGPSSKAPKGKSKAKPRYTPEELERRKVDTDVQAVTDRQSVLKRQRRLAAAQRKRLLEMKLISATSSKP